MAPILPGQIYPRNLSPGTTPKQASSLLIYCAQRSPRVVPERDGAAGRARPAFPHPNPTPHSHSAPSNERLVHPRLAGVFEMGAVCMGSRASGAGTRLGVRNGPCRRVRLIGTCRTSGTTRGRDGRTSPCARARGACPRSQVRRSASHAVSAPPEHIQSGRHATSAFLPPHTHSIALRPE